MAGRIVAAVAMTTPFVLLKRPASDVQATHRQTRRITHLYMLLAATKEKGGKRIVKNV
jgi:preprotein translocase subunit Sec63